MQSDVIYAEMKLSLKAGMTWFGVNVEPVRLMEDMTICAGVTEVRNAILTYLWWKKVQMRLLRIRKMLRIVGLKAGKMLREENKPFVWYPQHQNFHI